MTRDAKKISKSALIILLCLLFSACIFGFFGFSVKSKADATIDEIQLKTQYDLYDNVSLPDAVIHYEGADYDAEKLVIFPSGSTYLTSAFQTSEEGTYRVQYRAKIAQQWKVFEKTFVVSNKLFTSTGASEIALGSYDATEHDPFGIGTTGRVEGLKVSLSGGGTFTYNNAINLNDYAKSENLLSFCITPEEIGTADTLEFYVYLTDAYDETNVVRIKSRTPSDVAIYGNSYISAKAIESMQYIGWEWNFSRAHVGGNYGFPVGLNPAGILNNSYLRTIADNSFNISFDYAERQLHSILHASSGAVTEVCDFDNPRDFSTLWKGFTTGECYISIYCPNNFNFVITKIGRQDLSDLSFIKRNTNIDVDLEGANPENLPKAEVNKPYGIFASNCVSPYFGKLDVIPHVYLNYGTPEQFEILVENGKFVPFRAGIYSLVYEAKDYFGENVTKVFTVEAVDTLPAMSFDFTGIDNVTSGKAGDYVTIEYPLVRNASGRAVVKAYAKIGDAETEILNGGFRPEVVGEYSIIFRAIDHCERVIETEYYFTSLQTEAPTFIDEPTLPDCFISGEEYVLPSLKAYNFMDGSKSEIDAVITVIDDEGERIIRKGSFVPYARKNGKDIIIRYSASVLGSETTVLEYSVPAAVVKTRDDYLLLKNYFYTSSGRVTATEVGEYSTKYYVYEDTTIGFAKPVMADGFVFKFGFARDYAAFNKFSVFVRDSVNPNEAVKLTYYKGSDSLLLKVNDEIVIYPVTQTFDSNDVFTIGYSAQNKGFTYDTSKNDFALIEKTIYGEDFKGFSSNKIWFSISVEGVSALTKIRIDSVSGQLINNDEMEFIGPNIAILGVYGGMSKLGAKAVLPKAISEDVITSASRITMTVKDPDNNFVTSVDGVELRNVEADEYKIVTNKIGRYMITYVATDSEGNTEGFSYIINVLDEEPPVITVKSDIRKNYTLGETVYLSSATATDNVTQNPEVHINVLTPKGYVFMVENKNGYAFKPISAGKYRITYWCVDGQGNMETFAFEINVA